MGNRDYSKMGQEISRAVRDVVNHGDFEGIGRAVGDGVQNIGRAVGNSVQSFADGMSGAFSDAQNAGPQRQPTAQQTPIVWQPAQPVFPVRMPGSVSGLVCAIIGFALGVPLLIADIAVVATGAAHLMPAEAFAISASILLSLTAASFALASFGVTLRRRARRFNRYRSALGGASFGMVQTLADAAGLPPDRARKDLKKMISLGACPHGHLDHCETCFMVDDETYEAYLDAEKSYEARKEAERTEEQQRQTDPKRAELEAVRAEGGEYLRQIRAANDALPGQEISDRLARLESVSARIFLCVEQHPEKLPDIRRLMRYYLPTTLKLVNSYREFSEQPAQGENITNAKSEIERALDTVNAAFENLLDSLYAEDALDLSSDISALETMLKQEGLTGSDFADAPHTQQ